jgi:hypothetical protein
MKLHPMHLASRVPDAQGPVRGRPRELGRWRRVSSKLLRWLSLWGREVDRTRGAGGPTGWYP